MSWPFNCIVGCEYLPNLEVTLGSEKIHVGLFTYFRVRIQDRHLTLPTNGLCLTDFLLPGNFETSSSRSSIPKSMFYKTTQQNVQINYCLHQAKTILDQIRRVLTWYSSWTIMLRHTGENTSLSSTFQIRGNNSSLR